MTRSFEIKLPYEKEPLASFFFCIKATKKIFLEGYMKDSNSSNVNEIVRCTMKSSAFGFR